MDSQARPGAAASGCQRSSAPPTMAAAARRALSRACSRLSPRASVTPMRRLPCTSGLPNRRSCVSGSASACSTAWKHDVARLALEQHRAGGGRPGLADHRHRQPEDRAGVQRELRQVLRHQRHEAGVVRPWRDLAEPDVVAADEQLHAEQAGAAEVVGHGARDALGRLQRSRAHRLRLPRLAVVAVDLQVADRRAETRAAGVTHREQRDLVVEADEPLDDDATRAGAPAALRVLPGGQHVSASSAARSGPCRTSSSRA